MRGWLEVQEHQEPAHRPLERHPKFPDEPTSALAGLSLPSLLCQFAPCPRRTRAGQLVLGEVRRVVLCELVKDDVLGYAYRVPSHSDSHLVLQLGR